MISVSWIIQTLSVFNENYTIIKTIESQKISSWNDLPLPCHNNKNISISFHASVMPKCIFIVKWLQAADKENIIWICFFRLM